MPYRRSLLSFGEERRSVWLCVFVFFSCVVLRGIKIGKKQTKIPFLGRQTSRKPSTKMTLMQLSVTRFHWGSFLLTYLVCWSSSFVDCEWITNFGEEKRRCVFVLRLERDRQREREEGEILSVVSRIFRDRPKEGGVYVCVGHVEIVFCHTGEYHVLGSSS